MKSILLKVAGALVASTFIAAPVMAQTGGGSGGSAGATTTESDTRSDNKRDWGWLGLLGLIGLAGMRRKHDDGFQNTTRRPA